MKTFTAKSSAVRAAAKALGISRKIAAIEAVAIISQNDDGLWTWVAIEGVKETIEVLAEEEEIPAKVDTVEVEEKAFPTVTLKECCLLVAIAESEMTELNGAEPDTIEQTGGYAYAAMDSKSDGGAMTSLIEKDLAWFDDSETEDKENLNRCGLTAVGFAVYKAYKTNKLDLKAASTFVKEESKSSPKTTGKTWKRPGAGTKTGRIWELADSLANRKEVMVQAAIEGLNLNMAAQQYHRWSHRV